MDFSERIKQIKELYINHPLERINKLKEVMSDTYAEPKDIKNAKSGIITARNNYNIISFDFHTSWLNKYLSENITIDSLKEQFNTIAGLLNDMCEDMSSKELNSAIYDALVNEINVFDDMFNQIELNNQDEIKISNMTMYSKNIEDDLKITDDFIKATKKEYNKKPNVIFESLLKYRNYLDLLVKFYANLERNIDIYQNIEYHNIELNDRINKVLYNSDTIFILKGIVDAKRFKEIEIQNNIVNDKIRQFKTNLKEASNLSTKDVSMLILNDKAAIRQLIKMIDENIPLENKETKELKESEVSVSTLPVEEHHTTLPQDSIDKYDTLMQKKKELEDSLNSITEEEERLHKRHDELEYSMDVKKTSGGKITLGEAIEECTLRMKSNDYKKEEKAEIFAEQDKINEELKTHKFNISDILRRVRFNSFGYFRRILFGKETNLSRYDKYVAKKKNKQKTK